MSEASGPRFGRLPNANSHQFVVVDVVRAVSTGLRRQSYGAATLQIPVFSTQICAFIRVPSKADPGVAVEMTPTFCALK